MSEDNNIKNIIKIPHKGGRGYHMAVFIKLNNEEY